MIWNNFIITTNAARGMSAPYGDMAPYLTSRILFIMVTTTIENCVRKLEVPSAIMDVNSLKSGRKLFGQILKFLLRNRYAAQIRKLTNWPRMVARAAP